MPAIFTLKKDERVKSRDLMNRIFKSGSSTFGYPFKLVFIDLGAQPIKSSSQILFSVSVPKRIHKTASQRNRIKRIIKESYRLLKPELLEAIKDVDSQFAVMYIYISKEEPEFGVLRVQMSKLHQKWVAQIKKGRFSNGSMTEV